MEPAKEKVRQQYEKFPYPPLPVFALPRRDTGKALSIEIGRRLIGMQTKAPDQPKILVAGAGTLEALVVAQNNLHASKIIAVDLSKKSLRQLKIRTTIRRLADRFLWRKPLPPIQFIVADLQEWDGSREGPFDYIVASNVIHHVEDPAALLGRLSGWLRPEGLLRLVTYPKASRIWMRETAAWLALNKVNPGDRSAAKKAVRALPSDHPVRSCFESHPEVSTSAGLTDAFFHSCENPLSPLEWKIAAQKAGLRLAAEAQTESSQSHFLEELLPKTKILDRWEKLEVLDRLLELCANPVLWFVKEEPLAEPEPLCLAKQPVSSEAKFELAQNLRSAETLLKKCGVTLEEALTALKTEVGPRVSAPPEERPLPGLSITDYDARELLALLNK